MPRNKLNDWFNGSKLSLVFQVLDKYLGIEIFEQPELVGWWKYVKTCLNDLLLYEILTTRKEGLWWVNSTHLTFWYYVIKWQKILSHSILKGENLLEKSSQWPCKSHSLYGLSSLCNLSVEIYGSNGGLGSGSSFKIYVLLSLWNEKVWIGCRVHKKLHTVH